MKNLVLTVFLLVFYTVAAGATPSGLNNIPTADVTGLETLVFQTWVNLPDTAADEYYSGFKYGLTAGIEIGIDGKLSPGQEGPFTFQFKSLLADDSEGFRILAGVEGISESDRAGEEVPYLVLSKEFKGIRAHLGYTFLDNQGGAFFGLDKTFEFQGKDLTVRGDIKKINNKNDLLRSFGFMYPLVDKIILESWISSPDNASQDVYTIKFNYVF
ncbi:MAG: hypothetical protein QGH40_05070 [bacterium]|jgi:uncharacterized protein YfiM (DUF2279 family)|nr:hypothetical protein [bacterium]